MTYRCTIFDSLEDLDAEAWDGVCAASGALAFLDRRFVAAVIAGMKDLSRFWFVLVHDEAGRPVACTALSTMTIDIANFLNPKLPWILRRAPGIIPRLRNLQVLICGLPGSPGEKNMAIAPSADGAQVLRALDDALTKFATDARMLAVIYREFGPADLNRMDGLIDQGYARAEIPQMYMFNRSFPDFDTYCAALRRNYRREIGRSRQKLKDGGLRAVVLSDPAEMVKIYTPEVHQMHCAMVARSAIKQDPCPIEYFQELATRLAGDIDLVTLMRGSTVVAMGWCLYDRGAYHLLYAGVDYESNREFDLYFNLMFACFERAFARGVGKIHVGQASSFFKARIGAEPEGRYVYVKGLGPIMSRVARYLSGRLVANDELAVAPSQSFKATTDGTDDLRLPSTADADDRLERTSSN